MGTSSADLLVAGVGGHTSRSQEAQMTVSSQLPATGRAGSGFGRGGKDAVPAIPFKVLGVRRLQKCSATIMFFNGEARIA
jgi:hypothetical protein